MEVMSGYTEILSDVHRKNSVIKGVKVSLRYLKLQASTGQACQPTRLSPLTRCSEQIQMSVGVRHPKI